jgi:hypothetical protein
MAALPRDVIKHLETQLPLLHLEREYTPHTRPRTDPVSGQTLPGNALTGFAFRVCWGVRADWCRDSLADRETGAARTQMSYRQIKVSCYTDRQATDKQQKDRQKLDSRR